MPKVALGNGHSSVNTGHNCTTTTTTDVCSTDVFANNIGICRNGDAITEHTQPVGDKCVLHSATITSGSATVFVNNIEMARNGDSADAGSISSGSENVFAGG